jgi:hypothetical protein
MNPFFFIQMLPYASLTLFVVGSLFFQTQFSACSPGASLVPMACFAAVRTLAISLFAPILTFLVIGGFLDTVAWHDGAAHMRLYSCVTGLISLGLLVALSFGTSFGLTMLSTKLFGGMVALKDAGHLFWSIAWLLALEAVAVTVTLVLQLLFMSIRP